MGNKILIIVDMQNDFIEGVLGTPEARKIVPNIIDKIKNWDGDIILTMDTHTEDYLLSYEGKHLPIVHCIKGTAGYKLNAYIEEAAWKKVEANPDCNVRIWNKFTFGDYALADNIDEHPECIEIIGVCTDICVISNALIMKVRHPETEVIVDANCCAGTTPTKHREAIDIMKSCQVIINE